MTSRDNEQTDREAEFLSRFYVYYYSKYGLHSLFPQLYNEYQEKFFTSTKQVST